MATQSQKAPSSNTLAQRFELVRKLGDGGYGVVYEAVDTEWHARVALKTLQRMDPDALLRFKEEFRSLQDLEHPNLVHLGELTCSAGLWFFTMELVEGTDFFDYVRPLLAKVGYLGARALDEQRLRRTLVQLVEGLIAVHDSGRVHCDIKPTNIRVDRNGRVVLLDFGLVTAVAAGRVDIDSDPVLGTPSYMAPEQCRGEDITPAADWYAVGVLLYEALTGLLPYTGNPTKVFLDKQHVIPTHPLEFAIDAPQDLSDLCMLLMSIDPAARPNGQRLRAVLRGDATAPALEARERSSRISGVELSPFIGRSTELAFLREQLGATRDGRPAFVYVSGESGVGKSALVRCFAEEVPKTHSALVLRSRCYERETVPYKAFDGIVDDLARHLAQLDPVLCRALLPGNAKLLIQIFPVLSRVKPLRDLPLGRLPQDPHVLRSQAFSALREIFARLAVEQSLLLVIDDLQWADVDSLSLMDDLLTGSEAPACMLLATGRALGQLAPELSAVLGPLLRYPIASELPLEGLAELEAEQLVRVLARREHDTGMLVRIAREAKGHPLFVAELVRHVEAGNALAETRHLDEALRERVSGLDDSTRALLELLAVASTPIEHNVLACALDLEVTDLGRRLAQLRSAHLARSEDRQRSECYHDRIRSAVLESLTVATRQLRHRSLAQALSALGESDVEQVAYQWRCAGDVQRAARYCARGAEIADRALAFNRAARLYEEALSEPQAFQPERLFELRLGHARALSSAGFSARAAEVYLEAAAGRPGEQARVLRRQATQLMLRSGRIQEGLKLADAVLGEVGLSRPSTPTGAVLRLAWERTRLAARGLSYQRPDAEQDNEPSELLELLWAVAPSLAFVDLLGGAALQSQYARLALSSGNIQHLVRSLTIEAMLHSTTEVPTQAKVLSILQQVRELADGAGQPYLRALVWMSHGYVDWVSFRLSEAMGSLIQAERLLRERCVDVAWELTNARAGLLNAMWNTGRMWQHEELAREWQRDARDRGDRYAVTQLLGIGVGYQRALRAGDAAAAGEALEECLTEWTDAFQIPHWTQYIGRQLVGLYRGDGSAYALLRATWPRVRRSQLLGASYLGFLTYTDAAWACLDQGVRSPHSERQALLRETSDYISKIVGTRRPLAAPLARQIEGQACVLAGPRDVAIRLLRGAETELRQCQSVYQYPTAYLLGTVIQGDEGRALRERALDWASNEGIADPDRWFCMFAPVLRALR